MDLHLSKNDFGSPIKDQTTQHTAFEIGLLIIVIGLFYWFIVMPKKAAVETLQTQYQTLSQQQATVKENKKKLATAIAEMKAHPQEVAIINEALPLDNRVTKLYIALESLTQDSGMTVGNINISYNGAEDMAGNKPMLQSPFTAKRTLHKLTTALNVTGTFDQFQALLNKIESSGRLINMSSLSIDAGKDQLLNFNVNLEAYYYE